MEEDQAEDQVEEYWEEQRWTEAPPRPSARASRTVANIFGSISGACIRSCWRRWLSMRPVRILRFRVALMSIAGSVMRG